MEDAGDSTTLETSKDMTKTKISVGSCRVSEIEEFLFPPYEQHPLSTDRLILVGLYGPLVDGHLRGGRSMMRHLTPREIEIMCKQVEQEDILQIYVPNGSSGLTNTERQFILNQASLDHKTPKGKAHLPQMTRSDFHKLIHKKADFESDEISFHELQKIILKYRQWRIKKLRHNEPIKSIPDKISENETLLATLNHLESEIQKLKPPQEINENTTLHGILDPSRPASNVSLRANLMLLRRSERDRKLDAAKDRLMKETSWDSTSNLKGTGLPSMVGDLSLKSTRRKYTLY